jgi:transcriptional regulator with PAS, ATPase and Fis domain
MKKDVTELKKILLKLIESGNTNAYDLLSENMSIFEDVKDHVEENLRNKALPTHQNEGTTNLNINTDNLISESEDAQFEEIITTSDVTLSLEKQEKEIIIRALKKNKNKRKYAAKDLGISERTLYRKIKQYDLEDNV